MTTPNWEVPGARPAEGWPGEAGPPQPWYGPYDGPPGFGPPPAGPRRTNGLAVAALIGFIEWFDPGSLG